MLKDKNIDRKDLEILKLKAGITAVKEFILNMGSGTPQEKQSLLKMLDDADKVAQNTTVRNIAEIKAMIGENEFSKWMKEQLSDITFGDLQNNLNNHVVTGNNINQKQSPFKVQNNPDGSVTISGEFQIDKSGHMSKEDKEDFINKIFGSNNS
jgi:hypothetical protein